MSNESQKFIVGALEICDLPSMLIKDLHVRVDTGAAKSSLHVDNIEEFERHGECWVRFDIHSDIQDVEKMVKREAKVEEIKKIKS